MESLVPVENGLGLYAHDYAPSALDWAGFDRTLLPIKLIVLGR